MTTATNSPQNPTLSHSSIANNFVFQYYNTQSKTPQNLYHFYKDDSYITRGTEDNEVDDTASGAVNIKKKIQSLQLQDCKISLTVVDAQPSVDGGIVITAIGYLSNKGETPKKFVQTFFLAKQVEPNGFYVRNDVFRYLKDTVPAVEQVASPDQVHNQEKPKEVPTQVPPQSAHVEQPAAPQQQNGDVQKAPVVAIPSVQPTTPPTTTTTTTAPVVPPQAQQPASPLTQVQSQPTPVTVQQDQQPKKVEKQSQDKKDAPASDVKPEKREKKDKKDGDVAADKKPKQERPPKQPKPVKDQTQQQQQPPAPQKPSVTTWASVTASSNTQPAPPPQVILEQQKQEIARKVAEEEKAKDPDNLPSATTVFVTNVPYTATEEAVRAVFVKYGVIKTVLMRKGSCFIEFNSTDVMKSAIDKSTKEPLVMEGRTLGVESKRSNKTRSDKGDRNKEGKPRKTDKPNNYDSPRDRRDRPQGNNAPRQQTGEKAASKPKPRPATQQ